MMKLNHINKYLLGTTLLLIMAVGILFALYRQIATNKKVVNQIEAQWQGEIATQTKIKNLEKSIGEITKERDAFESHFAKSSDIVPFLDTIEKLALKVSAKAVINTVDITEEPLGLVIGIHSSGSFESVYKFMMLLENSPYELEILTFDLRREGNSTDIVAGNWNLTLKVRVLSFSNK